MFVEENLRVQMLLPPATDLPSRPVLLLVLQASQPGVRFSGRACVVTSCSTPLGRQVAKVPERFDHHSIWPLL
jgi:hypothetical protein